MRAAVSLLVSLLLLTIPVTLVLAQAEQQQDAAVEPHSVADAARVQRAIIGVPELDPRSRAALLLGLADRPQAALDFAAARDWLPPLSPTPTPISGGAKAWLIVLGVLVGLVLIAGIYYIIDCSSESVSCD